MYTFFILQLVTYEVYSSFFVLYTILDALHNDQERINRA